MNYPDSTIELNILKELKEKKELLAKYDWILEVVGESDVKKSTRESRQAG